jgi:hypothetical protein
VNDCDVDSLQFVVFPRDLISAMRCATWFARITYIIEVRKSLSYLSVHLNRCSKLLYVSPPSVKYNEFYCSWLGASRSGSGCHGGQHADAVFLFVFAAVLVLFFVGVHSTFCALHFHCPPRPSWASHEILIKVCTKFVHPLSFLCCRLLIATEYKSDPRQNLWRWHLRTILFGSWWSSSWRYSLAW